MTTNPPKVFSVTIRPDGIYTTVYDCGIAFAHSSIGHNEMPTEGVVAGFLAPRHRVINMTEVMAVDM